MGKLFKAALTLTAAFLVLAASAWAGPEENPDRFFWGRVVNVQDGDTITVVRSNDSLDLVIIRLYGIDAPESGQAFGTQAASKLRRLVHKKIVQVEIMQKSDRYGRIVGIVKRDGDDVSMDLLYEGLAWVYPKFCRRDKPCKRYWAIARKAEKARMGLWKDKNPMSPWKWRKK